MGEAPTTTGLGALHVDGEALRASGTALSTIATGFNTDDALLHIALSGIGEYSGSGTKELREAAEDFSEKWRIRRNKIKESVTDLSGTITTVAENFERTDASLSYQIRPLSQRTPNYGGAMYNSARS